AEFWASQFEAPEVPKGHLLLQTLRSHDQWNTIWYAPNDRYRGIHNARRVVMANPEDLAEFGIADGEQVDLVSVWHDGERRAEDFTVV
ncbi:molybdopterin dinucleotide binding domain-containing protein, partial [Escherichia coli]|uniref:molybdopterin dinucleotide binding domain-containing protein n=1 Tax=Escherichia coli TaxID=562 RepID=UPI0028125291